MSKSQKHPPKKKSGKWIYKIDARLFAPPESLAKEADEDDRTYLEYVISFSTI